MTAEAATKLFEFTFSHQINPSNFQNGICIKPKNTKYNTVLIKLYLIKSFMEIKPYEKTSRIEVTS